MNSSNSGEKSDIFLIFGSASPQRFEILWQMAEYLIFGGESVEVCLHSEESPPESAALERLQDKAGFSMSQWNLEADSCDFDSAPIQKPNVTTLFLSHGTHYLVDTFETLSHWLPDSGFELQRVTTWVDCKQVHTDANAKKWYECCFHFSDLVILDEFKTLPDSWFKEYKDFFKKECYPCIVENTRKGRLHNMFVLMDNQLRRIAQVFEKTVDFYAILDEDEEEMEENEPTTTTSPKYEPYFERLVDGRRSKVVPEPLSKKVDSN